ncbi:AraC family transcriptional regulator [Shewanella mangrovi]|uniref:AraC family transcriptional regulator n=1 Tax=Shewanella mangrovi TaxID=1515746 RepID=A0A094JFH4_9GAMM|nr:helix-turn-helix domain-containing protein [Shewanella mangrovi]KFZ38700.1 AraC family transcriptional regulator [Shewanella mangrovi]
MSRSYSTQDVRAQESFDYWQDLVENTYVSSTNNKNLTEGKFSGELKVKSLGARALITRIKSTPMEYRETLEGKRTDDYFICLSLCPKAHLSQNDQTSTQLAGDIVLYDNRLPFCYSFPEGDNQIVISLPHAVLTEQLPDVELYLNKTLSSCSPLGRFVGTMIQQAWENDELEEIFGDQILNAILALLKAAYHAATPSTLGEVQQYRRDTLTLAKQYIQNHLGETSLSVETISLQLHMSARTLSRLFSRDNTSVMRWVWQQRLQACHRVLLSQQDTPISDIAYQFGFSNLSHFNKLFKDKYGITPTELRQQ